MSFFGKTTLNRYNAQLDVYLDYCSIALAGPTTVVHKDYGRFEYIRTRDMLKNEILEELHKNYSSPDQAITYMRNRRFMFA